MHGVKMLICEHRGVLEPTVLKAQKSLADLTARSSASSLLFFSSPLGSQVISSGGGTDYTQNSIIGY